MNIVIFAFINIYYTFVLFIYQTLILVGESITKLKRKKNAKSKKKVIF